jgi:hypothetical protein
LSLGLPHEARSVRKNKIFTPNGAWFVPYRPARRRAVRQRLVPRLRRVNLAAGLRQAGFTDVEVRDRPSWLARERALWEEAAVLDPGDNPALRSLHDEAVRSLQWTGLLRRVLAVATNPL